MANLDAEKSAHLGASLPSVAASAENTGRRVSREWVVYVHVIIMLVPINSTNFFLMIIVINIIMIIICIIIKIIVFIMILMYTL